MTFSAPTTTSDAVVIDEAGGHHADESGRRRSVAGPVERVSGMWRKRRVLLLLVRRDLKVRYSTSLLGYLWSVLDPLMMGLVYWFVFTKIFHRDVGEEPYIVFLLSGMLPFLWFQSTLNGASTALKGERLVRSVALPREIWVIRLVSSKGMEFVFSIPVILLFAIGYQAPVSWALLYVLPAMAIQTVLLTGLALIVAPVVVLVRDVDRVVRILLRFMFYATPIIYGLPDITNNGRIPDALVVLYQFNPMSGVVSLYRAGFFYNQLEWNAVLISIAMSVVILFLGWWIFARLERAVLKEI